MRRLLLVVVAALLLLGAAAALMAPAALLSPAVAQFTGSRVGASDLEGSLWNGRGVLSLGDARLPVAWQVDALPLASGELRAHVMPADAAARAPRAGIVAAPGRLALSDLDVTLGAGTLADALVRSAALRAAWRVDGDVTATTARLDLAPGASAGDLRIVWRDARAAFMAGPPVDAGELTVALTAAGDRLAGPVTNRGGDLDVRGDVAVTTGGAATVSLLVTPRRADNAALARGLAAIGTPEGAGWRVQWQAGAR